MHSAAVSPVSGKRFGEIFTTQSALSVVTPNPKAFFSPSTHFLGNTHLLKIYSVPTHVLPAGWVLLFGPILPPSTQAVPKDVNVKATLLI